MLDASYSQSYYYKSISLAGEGLAEMRTNFSENANFNPERRRLPSRRLWPRVTVCGSAVSPQILGVNSCTDQDLVVADSILRSRLELQNNRSADREDIAYFCIYMADQATWLEPETGGIQEVDPFDIAIINSEVPLRTVSMTGTRHLSLFLPRSLVLARLPWADEICGQGFKLESAERIVAQSLGATLRTSIDLRNFDAVAPCLVQSLLALVASVNVDAKPRPNQVSAMRQEQVAQFIKSHFQDPALSVTLIAKELKVSARYLQRVCKDGASPGEQLRQFRLRKAAARLSNAAWHGRTISEICYSCGFSSSSHFSTEFRRFYGVTPKEYRS
jgi:AraC family transcriptional activator of tynA and feaB